MDPGNWATDIAAGSKFGYKLLWVLLMSNFIALLLQSLSARLGIVTGRDLAQASRESYPRYINIFLYLFAEIAIAACDLAEVLGMAIGLQLLFHIPLLVGVSITVLDSFLLIYLINFGVRKMEAFILCLVAIIGLSFLAEMIFAKPEISLITQGLKPSFLNDDALYLAIGIIGATVMPHNLYLHSSLVQTRKFEHTNTEIKKAIRFNLIDSVVALNLAFFVNASILILAAATFFRNGMFDVAEIQDAHKFLAPLIGNNLAPILFAVALIAAGQSSTITGTLAGQIVMEGYLNLRIAPWVRRLITRLLAIIPAFIVIYIFGEGSTGQMLVMSQVILSMQLGFAIIPMIQFVSDKNKMADFAIGTKTKVAAWLCALIIVSLNLKLVYEFAGNLLTDTDTHLLIKVLVVAILVLGLFILGFILIYPSIMKRKHATEFIPHGGFADNIELGQFHYDHIAVTLDFSKWDVKALKAAISLGGTNAMYHLIHISESASALVYGNETNDLESVEDFKILTQYKDYLEKEGYRVEIRLGFGNPKKRIPEIVREINPELLVMAAHGHNTIKDFLLGTTLDKVRHAVTTNIFIVRE